MKDPYTNTTYAAARLIREWEKHPRLIIACDFDDTVYDFHGEQDGSSRHTHDGLISLIQDCAALNFYIVVFTASAPSRWEAIRAYMKHIVGVEIAGINCNPIPLPYGNNGKMYYNILLDDRAGLGQAAQTLDLTLRHIKRANKVTQAQVIEAPFNHDHIDKIKIFLAGSIEMGKAEDWQSRMIEELKHFDCAILNPRRKDWDSSWEPVKENPKFREQVEWELHGLESANIIAIYYDPGTMSPISLLETGLHMSRCDRIVICCPPGYSRKGNVDITCELYGIPVHETWEAFVQAVKEKYTELFAIYGYEN